MTENLDFRDLSLNLHPDRRDELIRGCFFRHAVPRRPVVVAGSCRNRDHRHLTAMTVQKNPANRNRGRLVGPIDPMVEVFVRGSAR